MIFFLIFISLSLFNVYSYRKLFQIQYKCKKLEYEVIEYRKIKRKMNKWRLSQNKIIEILDNGIYRLKQLRLKRLEYNGI